MTPERFKKLIATLERRQPDLTLLTDQMHKPRNIAALVRTADAVGLTHVHMVWGTDYQRPFRGTALGSQQWVDICKHTSMQTAMTDLKGEGYQILAAHLSDRAVDYRTVDYTKPTVILLGNEKRGVSEDAAELANEHIIIPMMGMVESYNVSVAAAIILSEAQGQRAEKGMYDHRQLTDDQFWHTFFRWAHPKIASFCEERSLDYPPIDQDTGEIIDPSGWYASVR